MRIEYDKETDTLTITLRDVKVKESDEVRPGVIADFGHDGGVVGFEGTGSIQGGRANGRDAIRRSRLKPDLRPQFTQSLLARSECGRSIPLPRRSLGEGGSVLCSPQADPRDVRRSLYVPSNSEPRGPQVFYARPFSVVSFPPAR